MIRYSPLCAMALRFSLHLQLRFDRCDKQKPGLAPFEFVREMLLDPVVRSSA
jgi:hypothetical protein